MPKSNVVSNLFSFYIKFAIISAILYCIPMVILFTNAVFPNLWLLYLGNGLFICSVLVSVIYINHKADDAAGLRTMLIGGIKITILGVILSCILIILLLTCIHERLQQAPSFTIKDKTNGLSYILFFNAIIVNLPGGAFGALLGAISTKGNQKTVVGNELE